MEAPLEINETQKPNMNFQNKKSFTLKIDNINYILSLSFNDKLIFFEIEKEGEFPKKEYNLFLDLAQLYIKLINILYSLKIFLIFKHLLKL